MIFENKVKNIYRSIAFRRCDGNGCISYFSKEDFPGMQARDYSFKSSTGCTLKGCFYWYSGAASSPLVVFDHGIGGGHRSYMKEIDLLCREGYTVFAYDHIGCMESEGENCGGLCQSLHDLDDCLTALKEDEQVDTSCIYTVGHSWGGFACMNIPRYHKDVKKTVVISGFVSVEQIIKQNFPGILALYRRSVFALEKENNPKYTDTRGDVTLRESDTEALLIYSENDKTVRKSHHYDVLFDALSGSKNVTFVLEQNKAHNPNYTCAAVAYLQEMQTRLKKEKPATPEQQKAFKNSFDWHRMTEQDMAVWEKIFRFLKK